MKDLLARGSWIVTLPLAGLGVAYVLMVYLPAERADEELQKQLTERHEYLDQAKSVTRALIEARQELGRIETYQAQWHRTAPRRRNVASLNGRIHMLAKQAGATITRFAPGDAIEHSHLVELPISIGCRGGFVEMFDFLRRMESLPMEVWVKQIRFDNSQRRGQDVPCEMRVVVFTDREEISGYDDASE